MIAFLISDAPEAERKKIVLAARNEAALKTEEYWNYVESGSTKELRAIADRGEKLDLLCVDITMPGALDIVKEIHGQMPAAYVILIANAQISPVTYMRPQVGAESLMLKPLSPDQIRSVLSEAVGTYAERFLSPDETKVFVVENKGNRDLVELDRILYFESREKKVFLSTETEEYGFYDTLDDLEERLSDRFLRVHRSYLVNKSKIEKVMLSKNLVTLAGEIDVPVSRSCKGQLKEYISGRNHAGRKSRNDLSLDLQ